MYYILIILKSIKYYIIKLSYIVDQKFSYLKIFTRLCSHAVYFVVKFDADFVANPGKICDGQDLLQF